MTGMCRRTRTIDLVRVIRGWQMRPGMLVKGPLDGPTQGPMLILDVPCVERPWEHNCISIEYIRADDLRSIKKSIPVFADDHDELLQTRLSQSRDAYYGLDRWTVICDGLLE